MLAVVHFVSIETWQHWVMGTLGFTVAKRAKIGFAAPVENPNYL